MTNNNETLLPDDEFRELPHIANAARRGNIATVKKRVNRLKLVVADGTANEVRNRDFVIVPKHFKVAQQIGQVFRRGWYETGRRNGCAADPVLGTANLARLLCFAANALHQAFVRTSKKSYGKR